jgi:hypothetical protein
MATESILSTPSKIIKSVAKADGRRLTVTACLTYPVIDAAGDLVHPDGLEFGEHAANPWVDLEHNGEKVGSCWDPVKKAYGVSLHEVKLDNGNREKLPFSTTWFDPSDRLEAQTFAIAERGGLPGVSLEFRPIPGLFKSLGHKAHVPRSYPQDAAEFYRVQVVRYTHCAVPVCDGAQVVDGGVIRKAMPALLSILSRGKIGNEPLHPSIQKALGVYLTRPTMYRVGKAMDDLPMDAPPPEPTPEPELEEQARAMGGIAGL